MALTHFPYGVSSFGVPVLAGPGVAPSGPFPSGVGQISGYQGVQFVSATQGNDGFSGLDPAHPLQNIDTAFYRCAGSQNEIIYILGSPSAVTFSSGNTWSPASASTGLIWNKSETHLVGLAAPGTSGQRARVTNGASTAYFTPLITVSGSGCLFENIEFFNGGAHATEAAVCMAVTGSYNAFVNCQISGGGNTTNSTNAAMRSLTITGPSGENTFKHCYIGLDTILRNTTSTEIELLTGTPRNHFEDCTIVSYSSASTTLLLKSGVNGTDRATYFRNCLFTTPSTFSAGAALASAVSIDASGGVFYFHNCLSGGTACFTAFQGTPAANTFGDNAGTAAAVKGVAMTS